MFKNLLKDTQLVSDQRLGSKAWTLNHHATIIVYISFLDYKDTPRFKGSAHISYLSIGGVSKNLQSPLTTTLVAKYIYIYIIIFLKKN